MKKEFLPFDTIRINALKLAARIYHDGFVPDVIYVSLRGGACMANVISEVFKMICPDDNPVFYAAVVARSYKGVGESCNIQVDGWTYDPGRLNKDSRILLIDEIFDTGNTLNYLVQYILDEGLKPENVRVAVHDYKIRTFRKPLPVQPYYWCRKHIINSDEDDFWIHYMNHELQGLNINEIEDNYLKDNPELKEVFSLTHPELLTSIM